MGPRRNQTATILFSELLCPRGRGPTARPSPHRHELQNRLAGRSGNLGLGDRRWLRALLCGVDSRSGRVGRRALIAPRRLFRAFMRGRQAKTNLYHIGFDEKHLDQVTVAGLRDQLGVHMSPTPPALRDVALFSFWSVLAIGSWCPLPIFALALFWLIVRARLS